MNKLLSNYLYNVIYQFLIIALPLITIPYISRVLNPEGIGISSYSTSIIQVFSFFSLMGIQLYGSRQVASKKHEGKEELSKEFWSIYLVQLVSSITITLIYLFFVVYSIDNYKTIFLIQTFALIGTLLDISWFFIGLEELKKVILRNTVIKITSISLIFIFVKEPQDVTLYILINVLANVLGQGIMWIQIQKYISYILVVNKEIFVHLKQIFLLFLPLFFVQVYSIYNKVILGAITTSTQVGFYDQAVKIVQVALTIVTSIGIVMLPRISSEYVKGNFENIKKYTHITLRFVLFTTVPMCVGLIAVSSKLIPWFLGPGYSKVVIIIIIISPIVIFIGCANVFAMQILIPTKQQGKYTISVAIAAIISIIINFCLVSSYGSIATAIALLIAEGVGAVVQALFVRSFIDFTSVFKYLYKYFFASILMGVVVYGFGEIANTKGMLTSFLQVCLGIIIYFTLMILIKDKFIKTIILKSSQLLKSINLEVLKKSKK
ncbi:oligosaccharide flippase family protein [Peribacillus frigoritolerans]|uniref:oligosaccharide flippase family protein n=1 Tax=Peribacillus frigoritolerans TaxID=450367 RepID=UPI0021CF350E|nr:oligosaccharide flippase family protein [Peribacillus frigoritolerans]MCU6600461.1 oligosaccharide flippase family protein [Peribacillus frigoritolerans]